MGSLEVASLEPASFYRFRDELLGAGFETPDGGRSWTGPILEPLQAFTSSDEMTILIRDGWPFLHPELEVPGMHSLEHVNALGYVCLWEQGDVSQAWRTLDGWRERAAEWSRRQEAGFEALDLTMDADAYYRGRRYDALAVGSLDEFTDRSDGDIGAAYGRWEKSENLLSITTDAEAGGHVKGLWMYRDLIKAPPSDFGAVRGLITPVQRRRLDRFVDEVRRGKRRFFVLSWGGEAPNLLVVLLSMTTSGNVVENVLRFAPNDEKTLRTRIGHGGDVLRDVGSVVFGAGSVGSFVSLILAESGMSSLRIVDGARLRPGNVVRHACPADAVGIYKVDAVRQLIADHAPWAVVEKIRESPWNPDRIAALSAGQDVIVDATGNTGFREQLSMLAAREGVPLVTATLYRGGSIARIQRQFGDDVPILGRDDQDLYPLIPADPEAEAPSQLEAGCSSPVNEAPPRSVIACAALAAAVVVDAFSERLLPDEVTEVYRPLSEPPFDRVGRIGER